MDDTVNKIVRIAQLATIEALIARHQLQAERHKAKARQCLDRAALAACILIAVL